jgi:hypothetical protein
MNITKLVVEDGVAGFLVCQTLLHIHFLLGIQEGVGLSRETADKN